MELAKAEQILKNALLFVAIRQPKPIQDKIKLITKQLNEGADINTRDANDNNNTPLHVAILIGEVEIVELLLSAGAKMDIFNGDDQTALDMVGTNKDINDIFQKYVNDAAQMMKIIEESPKIETINNHVLKPRADHTSLSYPKRAGTAGILGQLYETKLLSLVLIKLLNNPDIEEFYLGTNVAWVGAFDDLVVKYKLKGKTKIMMLQAKHKEDAVKNKVTLQEAHKSSGEFSLQKYFDSYLDIRYSFSEETKDAIFNETYENADCGFIIYTSANENFELKKFPGGHINTRPDDIFYTSENGVTFQYDHEKQDLNFLLNMALEMRIKLLAKSVIKLIAGKISDDIRLYRVVFAKSVVNVPEKKFYGTFLDTDDNELSILREAIYEEILKQLKKPPISVVKDLIAHLEEAQTPEMLSELMGSVLKFDRTTNKLQFVDNKVTDKTPELENILARINFKPETIKKAVRLAGRQRLESATVKLPPDFGNLNFEVKKKSRLHELGTAFDAVMKNAHSENGLKVLKITDDMIGNDKILTKDLCLKSNGGFAGLVGNLLVLDLETDKLKLNNNEQELCLNSRKLYDILKSIRNEEELKLYRFDIDVKGFPLLSLINKRRDRALVEDFLDHFYFYTNQSKQNEVEMFLKENIEKYYNTAKDKNKYQIKSDAILQQAHKYIQSWWMNSNGVYLTKKCDFFDKAKSEIVEGHLLTKMKTLNVKFKNSVIESLGLEKACESKNQIIVVSTDDVILSSIKVTQYLKDKSEGYNTIDSTLLKNNYLETAMPELEELKVNTLVIVVAEKSKARDLNMDFKRAATLFKKTLFIMDHQTTKEFKEACSKHCYEIIDVKTVISDLSIDTQSRITNKKVEFQGFEIELGQIMGEESNRQIDSETLLTIFNQSILNIGHKNISSYKYIDEVKDYYVKRYISRVIKLDDNDTLKEQFNILIEGQRDTPEYKDGRDIIVMLITNQYYRETQHMLKDVNVAIYWFEKQRFSRDYILVKSQGCRENIRQFIKIEEEEFDESNKFEPEDAKSVADDIVIIAAEPGMGKSTLLSHFAITTKQQFQHMWIIRIDLRNYIGIFEKWEKQKSEIGVIEAVKFLCHVAELKILKLINEKNYRNRDSEHKWIDDVCEIVEVNRNQVAIKVNERFDNAARLELELFIHLYNDRKLILLLDGFDEIYIDYKAEAKKLFSTLKLVRYDKLWVTTRTYSKNDLEDVLDAFSYTLEPLSRKKQIELLNKFWRKRVVFKEGDDEFIDMYVHKYFDKISDHIFDVDKNFTSLPLNMYMIAVIFLEEFQQVVIEDTIFAGRAPGWFWDSGVSDLQSTLETNIPLNLLLLYERFVDVIFKIRYQDKMPRDFSLAMGIKKIISNERRNFYRNHKKLGAFVIFGAEKLKDICSYREINSIYELIDELRHDGESTGIIERIYGKEPKFIHFTYAEYFATEFLCDKLKEPEWELKWDFFAHSVLFSKENVRSFFDGKLAKDMELAALSSVQQNKSYVFKLLTTEAIYGTDGHNSSDVPLSSAVLVAIGERLPHITIFLLRGAEGYLNSDNLKYFIQAVTCSTFEMCALCYTVEFASVYLSYDWRIIARAITELVAPIDSSKILDLLLCGDVTSKDIPVSNPLMLAISRKREQEFVDIFLKDLTPSQLVEAINIRITSQDTVMHYASRSDAMHLLVPYIEKLNFEQRMEIFSCYDSYGRLPAHVGAYLSYNEIFYIMERFLTKQQFKTICLTRSRCERKRTPVEFFEDGLEKHDLERFEILHELKRKLSMIKVDNVMGE